MTLKEVLELMDEIHEGFDINYVGAIEEIKQGKVTIDQVKMDVITCLNNLSDSADIKEFIKEIRKIDTLE